MLRKLLFFIALLILIAIVLVMLGVVNLDRESDGSVSLEARDVEVGTTTTNVQLPVVRLEDRKVEVPSVGVEEDEPVNTQ